MKMEGDRDQLIKPHLLRPVFMEGESVLVAEGAQQLHGRLAANLRGKHMDDYTFT